MEDIIRELGNYFQEHGFIGSLLGIIIAIPMGLLFYYAAKVNKESMDKNKEKNES